MKTVLAIMAASRADTSEATEFLRVLVALRACAIAVELVEVGPGTGVLSGDPALTEDGERYLNALASNGITPAPATDLLAQIEAASDVVRLQDPRPSAPTGAVTRWGALRDHPRAAEVALAAGAFVRR